LNLLLIIGIHTITFIQNICRDPWVFFIALQRDLLGMPGFEPWDCSQASALPTELRWHHTELRCTLTELR
jgi:hypothetical protein